MKTLLITGFERFGDYTENITEVVASSLKIVGDYEVHGLVFPVRIFPENGEDYGETIFDKAKEIHADAIISMGISSSVPSVSIERQAINFVFNQKYCIGSEQNKPVTENYPIKELLFADTSRWQLTTFWDLVGFSSELGMLNLDNDGAIRISRDAGTFCCNALMFRTLNVLELSDEEIPYLFLHVNPLLNLNDLQKILETILKRLERAT